MPARRWSGLVLLSGACVLAATLAYGVHWLVGGGPDRTAETSASLFGSASPASLLSSTEDAKPVSTAELTEETSVSLSESERKYIWEIEQVALALDVHTFPRMARAIRENDRAALAAFVSDDFSGRVPDFAKQSLVHYPFGQFGSVNDVDEAWVEADKEQFVDFLLDQSKRFPAPRSQSAEADPPARTEFLTRDPRVEIRLMRLSPVDRGVLDGLWEGTVKIRFAGRSPSGGLGELELAGGFRFAGPGESIARRQAWLKSCRVYSSQLRESSGPLMKEVAAERGIDRHRFHDNWENRDQPLIVTQGGVYLCDYNRDGQLDILITDSREFVLFQGQSDGTFNDATAAAGLAGRVKNPRAPAVFVDLDGDGFEDLLLGLQVFRNNRDGTFEDVTALTNFRPPTDVGAFAVADYDLDGRMDIYVLRASHGPAGRSRVSWIDDQTGPGNQLWRNLGDWQFRNVTGATGTSAGHRSCFAAAWLDANSDGRPDLAVSDEFN